MDCAPCRIALGITGIEGGFPHSEIRGSKVVRTSPRLIAAYHVLHRHSAPRHPPDTLIALDRSHYRCPSHASPSAERCAPARYPLAETTGRTRSKTSFASNTSGDGGQAASTAGCSNATNEIQTARSLMQSKYARRVDRICSLFTMSDICASNGQLNN